MRDSMTKSSIRGVLTIAYLSVMSASLLVGLTIYERVTASDREAAVYINNLQETKTLAEMLNLALCKTVDNSLDIALDRNLGSVLAGGIRFSDEQLSTMIDEWLIRNEEASSVHIINLQGEVLSKSKVTTTQVKAESFTAQFSEGFLRSVDRKEGEPCFGIGMNLIRGDEQRDLFFMRRINDPNKLERIGYLVVFLDHQALVDKILPYLKSKELQVLLVDEVGETIDLYAGDKLQEQYRTYREQAMVTKADKGWKVMDDPIAFKDETLNAWLIASTTKTKKDTNLINIVSAILLVNLIFLTIGTIVVRRFIISPLEGIASKTRRINEEEDLTIRFEAANQYTEVGSIVKALNEMLEKINSLINENKKKEKQRRILELSVVNHQVNPHFLFNTLNSVNVLIAMEDKKTALKLVSSLSRYYRACLGREETINTVGQEVMMVKEYVNIMVLKDPGRLCTTFAIEERLYPYKVPRMVLQTLVENSIKYGIRTMEEPLQIQVMVREEVEKHRLVLTVKDNGKGIEQEVITKLMQNEKLKGKSGFGLRGTVKRIQLMYNIQEISEILEIDSKRDEYTKVSIFIPIG